MAFINNRSEFVEYCLTRLGKGVIRINVTEEQIDDRIDDALEYYWEHHYEAVEDVYYIHKMTNIDISNRFIEVPENLLRVIRAFPIRHFNAASVVGMAIPGYVNNVMSFQRPAELFTTSTDQGGIYPSYWSGAEYIQASMELDKWDYLTKIEIPIRFNRHTKRVFLDFQKNSLKEEQFILLECRKKVDPEENPSMYNDWWLKKYATALIKKQWGENLSKFQGIQLPGGVQFSGQEIYQAAVEEINTLEQEMAEKNETPALPLIL